VSAARHADDLAHKEEYTGEKETRARVGRGRGTGENSRDERRDGADRSGELRAGDAGREHLRDRRRAGNAGFAAIAPDPRQQRHDLVKESYYENYNAAQEAGHHVRRGEPRLGRPFPQHDGAEHRGSDERQEPGRGKPHPDLDALPHAGAKEQACLIEEAGESGLEEHDAGPRRDREAGIQSDREQRNAGRERADGVLRPSRVGAVREEEHRQQAVRDTDDRDQRPADDRHVEMRGEHVHPRPGDESGVQVVQQDNAEDERR